MRRVFEFFIAPSLLNTALCGCLAAGSEARPATWMPSDRVEARQTDSAQPIFTATYVEKNAPSLVGRRIRIDGYVENVCEKLAKTGCKDGSSRRRFVLFGDPGVKLTDPYQPCVSTGSPEVLLDGYFPASVGSPEGKRVVVSGVLEKRLTRLPQIEGSERRVLMVSTFQYVLQDAEIVEDPGTRCTFT